MHARRRVVQVHEHRQAAGPLGGHSARRGNLISSDSRRQLLRFVRAGERYEDYGLGVGKGRLSVEEAWGHFGAGPGFVTSVMHLPAKPITVAVLSSGQADLVSTTQLLLAAALKAR